MIPPHAIPSMELAGQCQPRAHVQQVRSLVTKRHMLPYISHVTGTSRGDGNPLETDARQLHFRRNEGPC